MGGIHFSCLFGTPISNDLWGWSREGGEHSGTLTPMHRCTWTRDRYTKCVAQPYPPEPRTTMVVSETKSFGRWFSAAATWFDHVSCPWLMFQFCIYIYAYIYLVFYIFSCLLTEIKGSNADSAEASDEKPVRLPGFWRCTYHSCWIPMKEITWFKAWTTSKLVFSLCFWHPDFSCLVFRANDLFFCLVRPPLKAMEQWRHDGMHIWADKIRFGWPKCAGSLRLGYQISFKCLLVVTLN